MNLQMLGQMITPEVSTCIFELAVQDGLEFEYYPEFLGPPMWTHVFKSVSDMPDGLGKDYLQKQLDLCREPMYNFDIRFFHEEDICVVQIVVPHGIYYFLMLGVNAIVAVAYLHNANSIWNFFMPVPVDEESPFIYEWVKV